MEIVMQRLKCHEYIVTREWFYSYKAQGTEKILTHWEKANVLSFSVTFFTEV